jgi:hypothetical protein
MELKRISGGGPRKGGQVRPHPKMIREIRILGSTRARDKILWCFYLISNKF